MKQVDDFQVSHESPSGEKKSATYLTQPLEDTTNGYARVEHLLPRDTSTMGSVLKTLADHQLFTTETPLRRQVSIQPPDEAN